MAKQSAFGVRLKALREKAGHTKYKLAQLSGVSQQTIAQLESGAGDPSWDTVKKLAHALEVSIDEFDTDKPGIAEDANDEKPKKKPNGHKPKK